MSIDLCWPRATAEKFSASIADITQEKWVSWRRHKVAPGDTLTSIAKKYRVTPAAIASANNLEKGEALSAGDKLIIPAVQPASETKSRLVQYRVRKGDKLLGIADRYSVSSDDLRKWNHLKAARGSRGMGLRIYTIGGAPEATPARARGRRQSRTTTKARASTGSA